LRVLSGIVTAPTLRSDGSLLDRPGYDTMTGLLFDTRGVEFPPIPARPTRDEARRALALFDELICKFPFATPEARAVALAGFLTICIRRMLPAAPLFGIDGTGAGSGKGLLADIIAIVGTGRQASPINTGANEEELEKRIASMMIRGDLVILLDNLKDPLDSAFLCTVLTQGTVSPRVLGESKTVKLPTHHMFMVTGNALAYFGDLNRRAITCLIDPKIENPSERVFDFDPIERAIEGRPRYVAAALTVLRAYQAAGRPKQSGKVMGSYGEWCRTVRDALLWLGEADPTVTCIPTNPDDPERQRFAAVVTAWNATIGTGRPVSAKEAGGIAIKASLSTDGKETRPELLDALQAVAAPMARANFAGIDPRRLSQWLGKKKGLVFSGLRFHPDDKSMHGRLWRLENVSRAGALDDDAS
jgi:putative DNA primase/helicase